MPNIHSANTIPNPPTNHVPSSDMSTNQATLLVKLTIGVIGAFAFLQVYSIQAILPVLMQAFHANETQVGMTVGATVLSIAIMSPFMGMLSDAIGRKNLILASIVFMAIPTAMVGLSQSLTSNCLTLRNIFARIGSTRHYGGDACLCWGGVCRQGHGKIDVVLCLGHGIRWVFGAIYSGAS